GSAFNGCLFLRGLTAPTFLLLSGFSFSLSTMHRWDSYAHLSRALWRRLGRFGSLVLLGYALHLPGRSVQDFRTLDAAGWQSWLQVDVLQCIGLTLMILQLLVLAARTHERFAILAVGLAISVVATSPLVWAVDWSARLPYSIATYFNAHGGSLFPLFPWSAYIFTGAAAGCVWARCQANRRLLLARALPIGSPVLILTGLLLESVPISLYGNVDFWKTSPNLFLIRVGGVGLLLGIVGYVERRLRIPGRAVRSLAQESLTIYFVHICVLYGSIWGPGMRQWIGPTLAPLPALGWILMLLVSMTLMGLGWNRIKRRRPEVSRWVVVSAMLALTTAYSL
ncbi:MAG: heparan-alpha-glucosaminide N-acetyltransferase domain-containing protein, partial [bacterium]